MYWFCRYEHAGWGKPVIDFYNRRGIAEQWLKEHEPALNWTRLSCHDLDDNRGNFLRRLALPASVQHWPLTTPGVNLIKTGAKMVHHARHVIFQMVERAVSTNLFVAILDRIRRWVPKARAGLLAFIR